MYHVTSWLPCPDSEMAAAYSRCAQLSHMPTMPGYRRTRLGNACPPPGGNCARMQRPVALDDPAPYDSLSEV